MGQCFVGLNECGSQRLLYLNASSAVSGTISEGLGGVVPLENECL